MDGHYSWGANTRSAAQQELWRHWAWWTGVIIDWLHIPGAIGVLLLGPLWLPLWLQPLIVSVVLSLQIVCLGCPLMVLSGYLRRLYKPDYDRRNSITAWLYRKLGPWKAAPLILLLLASSSAIVLFFTHSV